MGAAFLSAHSQKVGGDSGAPAVIPTAATSLFSWNPDARGLWKPDAPAASLSSYILQLIVAFAMYFAVGRIGLAVPFTSANVSPVWPAAGIGMALVLIWGVRIAPAIAVAAFFVNFFSPIPVAASVGIGFGNALSAVFGAYVLKHLSGFKTPLSRFPDLMRLIVFGAGLATVVAALIGVTSLTLMHMRAWSGYAIASRIWWLGDAMGVVVVTPLILNGRELIQRCRGWRFLELAFISGAAVVVSLAIFGPWEAVRDDVLVFVIFPFIAWAAIRFRIAGAALASLLTAAVAVWGTSKGFGPFVSHSPLQNAVLLQIFVAVTSLTGLVLAAVISEREHLQESVEERTRELEEKSERLASQAKLLDLANDAILVRNAAGVIAYWSEGAERLYGWKKEEAVGRMVNDLCHTEFPSDVSSILELDRWEGELQQRRRDGSRIIVASRWTTLRDHQGNAMGWLQINTDVTARQRAENAARSLSRRILSLEADERRRIARELHDSLGQYLTSLKINLDLFSRAVNEKKRAALLSESVQMVDQCLKETRTISHLLHPPLLDEVGFGPAARWYVDGFAQRSGIKVNLDVPPDFGRLRREIENALFRVVQEALTNVHRHSGGSAVDIRVDVDAEKVWMEVSDDGKGISKDRLRAAEAGLGNGIGLAGMRERVSELGGSLKIESSEKGTILRISIPLAPMEVDRPVPPQSASAAL